MTTSCRMPPDTDRGARELELRAPAAVVVAHPDDEALWLSSILGSVDRVVFCFAEPFGKPARAAARREAVAALPLREVAELGIAESGARFSVDWQHPRSTPTGIAIVDPEARARYEANYGTLLESLRGTLAGIRNVFTHSPWGEYGHAEHIQVHRAVAALQAELGFTLWFSNYVGKASWTLARQLARQAWWSERRILVTDRTLARRLKQVYCRHGAWTWTRAHRWPARETLYAVPAASDRTPRQALSGEDLLDVAGLRLCRVPWRRAVRRLP